jgi:hypothetical protein
MLSLAWFCLPVATKKYLTKKSFLSTPPNFVTLNWATVLDKKMKEQGLAH